MRRTAIFVLLLTVLRLIVIAEATSCQAASNTAAVERLRAAINYEMVASNLPAFSIALVDGDQLVWAEGFGYQDADRRVAATADTVYRVGSVSKLFTDLAVMQLAEQQKLNLDAPINDYLPEFHPRNPFDRQITLRQLMSHRAGLVREPPLGNYFDPDEPTLEATVASLNNTALVYEPESRTKYSNAGIAVVGAVLERQLQIPYSTRIEQTILQPLEMNSSSFVRTPDVDQRLAAGWMWTYDGRRFEAPKFALGMAPAGNMYSTVPDLAKFLICLFNDGRLAKESAGRRQIVSAETLRQMLTPGKNADGTLQDFGIGFHIQKLDGHLKIGHGGAVYGFSTQLEALPEHRLGVAAVASLDGSNGVVGRLSDFALRLMLAAKQNQQLPDYQMTGPVPEDRVHELVGTYRNQHRTAQITQLNQRVVLHRGPYRYTLKSLSTDGSLVTDDPLGFGVRVSLDDDQNLVVADTTYQRQPDVVPADIPDRWQGLIGEYGWDHNVLYILENQGQLTALIEWFYEYPLTELSENEFAFPDYGLYHGEKLIFGRDSSGIATQVVAAEVEFKRREIGTKDGATFKIEPLKPIDELRHAALAASPPQEAGQFQPTDLVDVTSLDSSIRLDIRYATTNNFTGSVFYQQPRAFLQRPAAEAVVRVHQSLKDRGLGLLIHDAYRPWHVTKMFWDATPDSMKDFVANPERGSRHNRGCAVDLTLCDLQTGDPISMVAGYDEFSVRSYPEYPGGTARQRWYRQLLRHAMEREGFQVYEFEWWHFDYGEWKNYRIGNLTFEQITTASAED